MRRDTILVESICERTKQIIDLAEYPTNMEMLEKFISELERDVDNICYERSVFRLGQERRTITITLSVYEESSITICGDDDQNYSINVDSDFNYVKTKKVRLRMGESL